MHQINCFEIELRVDDADVARDLAERVSRMHGTRIAPMIDRVCNEMSADDFARVELLELDLGSVAEDTFEHDLVAKLEVALRRSLAGKLRRGRRDSVARALELLETFALSGALPWWAEPRERDVVARMFALAVQEAEHDVIELLRR
jgi:hypothetical protein